MKKIMLLIPIMMIILSISSFGLITDFQSNIVACWSGDTGFNADIDNGTNFTGVPLDGVVQISSPCPTATGCWDFDSTSRVRIDNFPLNNKTGMIELLYESTAAGQSDFLIGNIDSATNMGQAFGKTTSNNLNMRWANSQHTARVIDINEACAGCAGDALSHSIIFNWNETTSEIWLDGVVKATGAGGQDLALRIEDLDFNFGARETPVNANAFEGTMEEIKIWNRNLPDNEKVSLYNSGSYTTCSQIQGSSSPLITISNVENTTTNDNPLDINFSVSTSTSNSTCILLNGSNVLDSDSNPNSINYGFSFDTTNLDDTLIFNISCSDNGVSNLTSSSLLTQNIDTKPPTITIVSVINGSVVSSLPLIFNITIDDSNVDDIIFDFNGTNETNTFNNDFGNTWTLTKDPMATGIFTYRLVINDTFDQITATEFLTFEVDNVTPTISFIIPNDLNTTSLDETGITDITGSNIHLDIGNLTVFNASGSQIYQRIVSGISSSTFKFTDSFETIFPSAPDGIYQFQACFIDIVNLETCQIVNMTFTNSIDLTASTGSLLSFQTLGLLGIISVIIAGVFIQITGKSPFPNRLKSSKKGGSK